MVKMELVTNVTALPLLDDGVFTSNSDGGLLVVDSTLPSLNSLF